MITSAASPTGDNTGVIGGAKGETSIGRTVEVGEAMWSEWRLVTEGPLGILLD